MTTYEPDGEASAPSGGLNSGYVYKTRVDAGGAGLALVDYLSRRYSHSNQKQWAERILNGRVLLDGRVGSKHERVRAGDRLEWRRPPWVEPAAPTKFAVVHEDTDLLVVAKPSGLPTLPGADYLENTLLTRVRRYDSNASPLHRLGRATSGLVVFSRTTEAHRALSENWRLWVKRWYRTLVRDAFPEKPQTCDVPIGPLPNNKLGRIFGASSTGKPAASRFDLLERRLRSSVVLVRIDTGRAHQIRIHAASLGHPLVGDSLYGKGPCPSPDTEALPGTGGYLLHAESVRIRHPRTQVVMELECRVPPELRLSSEEPNS